MGEEALHPSRREFAKWAAATGLATGLSGVLPSTAAAADDDADVVELPHALDNQAAREEFERANANDDPTPKLGPRLREQFATGERQVFDLVVRTVGERSEVTSERRGRTYRGWSPTTTEVMVLDVLGDVGHVPEFASTTVGVRNVDREDVLTLASQPSVISVLSVANDADSTDPVEGRNSTIPYWEFSVDADYVRSPEYANFEQADTSIDSGLKIGVVGSGYDSDQSIYPDHLAAGFVDESLATSWTDSAWDVDDRLHETHVADTISYMLQDGSSDLYVPLKVTNKWPPGTERGGDNVRAAIEYALRHDIEVLNLSLGYYRDDTCRGRYCDELSSYAAAGYVPVTSSGNFADVEEEKVNAPGTSYFTVTVGGTGSLSDGCGVGVDGTFSRHSDSAYGTIEYDPTACPFCATASGGDSRFKPDIYGPYGIDVTSGSEGDGEYVWGTSFATPVVTAAVALMKDSGTCGSFELTRDELWHSRDVCPADAAQAKGVVNAAPSSTYACEYSAGHNT